MDMAEINGIVLRMADQMGQIRREVDRLAAKENRVDRVLFDVRQRLVNWLESFDRDGYKSTDQRLLTNALADEVHIFDRLGYDIGTAGGHFVLGVAALLQERHHAALEQMKAFISAVPGEDRNLSTAHYLAGMICYNRRDYARAREYMEGAFRLSPQGRPDWQAKTYIAEVNFFLRQPREMIEKSFYEVEEGLKGIEDHPQHGFLRATLYLKLGNCYVGTALEPRERNEMVNVGVAIDHYKQSRRWCPKRISQESLLPVIIDFSLAQALLLAGSLDMDLAQTPSELLADVFMRLRRIVLAKREEIILAQSYFMLAVCAYYSSRLPKDYAGMYLEEARHQTLTVPSEVCFYSCVTKELLPRDEFVRQIDHYGSLLESMSVRR